MLVCTHQSLNHCNQVRKACVLCDKLTSGNKNTHRKRKWRRKAWQGGGEEEAIENRANVGFDPYRATSCPRNTRQRNPFPWSPVLNSIIKCPFDLQRNPEKSGSYCTPKQISKCGAQWPRCREHPHRVCSVPYHPHLLLLRLHGWISQAQMGLSAMRSRAWHALNNGRQMTSQLHLMMASANVVAFLFMSGNIRAAWFIGGAQVARD